LVAAGFCFCWLLTVLDTVTEDSYYYLTSRYWALKKVMIISLLVHGP
jgi:hypothetical protein